MLDGPVADILLDAVDADEVVDLVTVAAILARRGAHRPITDGNGLASIIRWNAYSCHAMPATGGLAMPRAMASQPRISCPEGQAPWQGGVR